MTETLACLKNKLELKLSGVHVVEKRRRRESGGDQAPPSDHWPPLMLPPDFFASKQTPPVSPVTSGGEEGRSMATKAICGLRQVGFGIDAASSEELRQRNGGKLEPRDATDISVSHHSFQ